MREWLLTTMGRADRVCGQIGRQGVGGRAGGAGDDEAVGALAVDEFAVDGDLQIDQPAGTALADDHVVEGGRLEHALAVAADLAVQQDALFGDVLAGEDLVHRPVHVRHRDVGEKAQPALVDADQRRARRGERARDGEHGAVAAQHRDHVGFLGQFVQIAGGAVLDVEAFGRLARQHHLVSPSAQEFAQFADGIVHLGVVVFADQADDVEGRLHEGRL